MSVLRNAAGNIDFTSEVDEFQEMSDGSTVTLVTASGAETFSLPLIVRDWRMLFVEAKDVIIGDDGVFNLPVGLQVTILTKGMVDIADKPA